MRALVLSALWVEKVIEAMKVEVNTPLDLED